VNVHRLPHGAAVHLVNYDYDAERDAVRRTGELSVSVRLPGTSGSELTGAVFHPADGEAVPLEVRSKGDEHVLTVPDLGAYGVVELTGVGA
jgi:hypothetical protein